MRDPKNLLMIRETFKKMSYRYLIDMNLMTANPFIAEGVYIKSWTL